MPDVNVGELLSAMQVPEDYDGPALEFVVRTVKPDNTAEALKEALGQLSGGPVAVFQKDKADGDFTAQTLAALGATVELKDFMDRVHLTKIGPEEENLGVAAAFVKWTFANVVNEVEDIIDAQKEIKHSQIQSKVEKMLEKPDQFLRFQTQFPRPPDQSLFEYPISVLVQSGNAFSVNRFNGQSDQSKLAPATIYANVCGKYRDMNVMASRTLLVNPTEAQKQAYLLAFEAVDVCTRNLVVGQPVKAAFLATKEFLQARDPELAAKTHTNFGFGVSLLLSKA